MLNLQHILRVTTYFIDKSDERLDMETMLVSQWLEKSFDSATREEGDYILKQLLDEKDLYHRTNRIDALVDNIRVSCAAIKADNDPRIQVSVVDLLVAICIVKYGKELPAARLTDLKMLSEQIAEGYRFT